MTIEIISVVPDLLTSPFAHSIMKRAADKGLLRVNVINLRDHTNYARAQVDDYQFGGGAGMVMMIEPLVNAVEALQKEKKYDEIIYLSPDGVLFDQKMANSLSLKNNLLMICGHYKGIDQRFRDHFVTKEISIGDYVLSGGELAAAVLTDAIGRLLPGVLNDESSALSDSFQDGLLAPPVYSSAGVTTGIDLMLHRIGESCGEALAAQVAQTMVVALRRGPQEPELSPFLAYRNHMHAALHRVQDAVSEQPRDDWDVPRMAAVALTSPRHLTRLFVEHAGVPPLEYLRRIRLASAQLALGSGATVTRAAERAGFSSDTQLRRAWRQFGLPGSPSRQDVPARRA